MTQFFTLALSRITYLLVVLAFGLFSLPAAVRQAGAASIALPDFSLPAADEQSRAAGGANLVGYDLEHLTLLVHGQAVKVSFVGALATLPEERAGLQNEIITYPALWNGVRLVVLNQTGGGVSAALHLAPFADPGQIQMRLSEVVQIQPDGSLRAELPGGAFSVSAPHVWQEIGGVRTVVPAGHVVTQAADGSLALVDLGAYDPTYPLVIEFILGGQG